MNNNGERKLFVPMIVETEPPLLRVSIGIDFHAVVSSRVFGGIGRQSDFEIVGRGEGGRGFFCM